MLALGLTAARFGQRPSELAGLEDMFGRSDPGCLDFNIAVGTRMEIHETECRKQLAKRIAFEVSKIFSDKVIDDDD